jgi:hypothetical protein
MGVMLMSHALSYILEYCSGGVGACNTMLMAWVSTMSSMMCAPLRALVGYLCVVGRVGGISLARPGIMCGFLSVGGGVCVTIDGYTGCGVFGMY